jgi:polyisoprenoid-binding protein YceI
MRKFAVALAALALTATPALAAPPHWTVDAAKSKLGFSVVWTGEAFNATFKSWKADIAFDPADLAHSRAVVTIAIASESSGFDENDEGLKGLKGFEVSRFPTATFRTTKITHGQGNNYVADGTLTIRGLTKPVTLPFALAIAGKTAHVVGKASLMRGDFGLARDEYAGDTPIARAVTVNIDLTATKP